MPKFFLKIKHSPLIIRSYSIKTLATFPIQNINAYMTLQKRVLISIHTQFQSKPIKTCKTSTNFTKQRDETREITIFIATSWIKRLIQESTADFHSSISFWSIGSEEASDSRRWVLTVDEMCESSEVSRKGFFSSGNLFLIRWRRRRGFSDVPYMPPSMAAIEMNGAC